MFSYYGSKSKIAHLYPAPKYGKIVEPFAGSARYSLLHFENDVILYDLSEYVVEVWKYLIAASEKDILSLPNVQSKRNIETDFPHLTDAERWLIGFHLCRGKAVPRKVGHGQNGWNRDKLRIAKNLYKIKHWKIFQRDYLNLPNENERATWFIDPPYQMVNQNPLNSDRYKHSTLNYYSLANWSQRRQGLVIVCEGAGAEYLPFKLLTVVGTNTNNRTVKTNKELIYILDR